MRIACLIILTTGAYGCTIATHQWGRTYIEKDSLDLIQVGQTSKQELQQTLGPPDWGFNNGSRWIYRTRYHHTSRDHLGTSRYESVTGFEIVDLTFDRSGVITTKDLLWIWSGTCLESIGCFHWTSNVLTVFASSDEDADAKQFHTESGECVVYLYSADSFYAIDIYSDGVGMHGRYWADTGFVRINLIAGERTVTVTYSSLFGQFSKSVSLNCAAGDVYFAQEHNEANDKFLFNLVSDDEGRRQIVMRNLMLLADLE